MATHPSPARTTAAAAAGLGRAWPSGAGAAAQARVGSALGGDLRVDGLPQQPHHGAVASAVVGAVVLVCKRRRRPRSEHWPGGPQAAWAGLPPPGSPRPSGLSPRQGLRPEVTGLTCRPGTRAGALTFGQPELQREGSGLHLGKGGRERPHPNIDWEGAAAHGVAAADSELVRNEASAWVAGSCHLSLKV